MAQKDPTAVAAKWAQQLAQAGPAYEAGVQAVKVAPGQLAAAAADTWVANVTQAKSRFQSRSASVSLPTWQQAAIQKGAPRLVDGASAAQPKMQAFMSSFLPKVDSIVQSLPARGSYAQNKARANAVMDALHQLKGTF